MNDSGINKLMWVFGGAGDDGLTGGDLNDWLYGGPGDDEIAGRGGDDHIEGEDGNDLLEGIGGQDTIVGGSGNDIIEGWGGNDWLYGGPGDDTIRGDEQNDYIFGGDGDDRIDGRDGDDQIWGDGNNSPTESGTAPGNDEIYGFYGNDVIYGGAGHDNLFGEDGDDTLYGGTGDDMLKGALDVDPAPPDDDDLDGESGNNYTVTANWPGDLDYPQVDLLVDVHADVVIDPAWSTPSEGWVDTDNDDAFNDSQRVLTVPGDPGEVGDGTNYSEWRCPLWTTQGYVYMTWAELDAAEGITNLTVEVEVAPDDWQPAGSVDQTAPPVADIQERGQDFQFIGGPFPAIDGELTVRIRDLNVPVGKKIVADAVLVRPRADAGNPQFRPGSEANRAENGFVLGLPIEMQEDPWSEFLLFAHDTDPAELTEKYLQLNFAFDDTVIRVWDAREGGNRIETGEIWPTTDFPAELYIEALAPGRTTLELVCGDMIAAEFVPLTGRPISDLLVVSVID